MLDNLEFQQFFLLNQFITHKNLCFASFYKKKEEILTFDQKYGISVQCISYITQSFQRFKIKQLCKWIRRLCHRRTNIRLTIRFISPKESIEFMRIECSFCFPHEKPCNWVQLLYLGFGFRERVRRSARRNYLCWESFALFFSCLLELIPSLSRCRLKLRR